MEMKLVAGTIRQPRARRGMVGRVLAKGLAKLGPIGEQDLERYHLGMVKDEAELAALEEHLLWCSAWVDRAGLLRGTWMPCEPQPANKPLARASGFTDGGLTSPTHGKEARQPKQRVLGRLFQCSSFLGRGVETRCFCCRPASCPVSVCWRAAWLPWGRAPQDPGLHPARARGRCWRAQQAEELFHPPAGRTTERSGVGLASGNEGFVLGDKTGTRHCLVAVTGTGGEERGVPVQMTVPPPTWPLATLPQPPSKRTQVPMAPAGLAPHQEEAGTRRAAASAATGPSKPCCGSCYSGRLEWLLWHRRAVFTSLCLSQGENNDEQAFIGDAPLICRNGFRRADLDRQDQR